jgi:ribosome biogenesis GTPase A
VLERSDVVCIVADVRNPLLHVPVALYEHCARDARMRIVIVLSKVDLVDSAHLARWKAHLTARFPRAALAEFSSKGRPVGGSTGGGVASRRKQINSPLTAAERQAVRAYVEGVAQACGVELPNLADEQVEDGAGRVAPVEDREARGDGAGRVSSEEEESEGTEEGGVASDTPGSVRAAGGDDEAGDARGSRSNDDTSDGDESDDEDAALLRLVASGNARRNEGAAAEAEVSNEEHGIGDTPALSTSTAARAASSADALVGARTGEPGMSMSSTPAGPGLTVGFVGHPNVGKTSLLNALVGRKVASVSRTPGHTKHLQTWELTPSLTICDSPGLVFPVAANERTEPAPGGAADSVVGLSASPRAMYECCGLFPIAQIREPFSAVRLLAKGLDLLRMYNLRAQDLDDGDDLSPLGLCMALAERKGYRLARGRGALDPHRAGLEVLRDCVDGAVCLAFHPPATLSAEDARSAGSTRHAQVDAQDPGEPPTVSVS